MKQFTEFVNWLQLIFAEFPSVNFTLFEGHTDYGEWLTSKREFTIQTKTLELRIYINTENSEVKKPLTT